MQFGLVAPVAMAARAGYTTHARAANYRPDIDGLRAIAVAAVVLFHGHPELLPGGFVGVDVFFVISGYLIIGIILNELKEKTFSIAGFYARRIRRIFPALLFVLATIWLVGWNLVLVPEEFRELGTEIFAGATFASNILTYSQTGYFDAPAATKPLLHLWSLGVEEQFYLIIPLALVALVRTRISIPWSLGAATLISFTLSMIMTGFDQAAAFYLPFTRFWELAVGGLLAYVTLHHREHVARLQHWTLSLAGLLIIATAVKITPFSFFPGWWAIPPVLGTTLVIAAGSATALNRILAWRPLVAIGLISYPLYLWHWPLLVLFREDYPFARGFILSVVTGSVLLAAATYLLIERPLRNLPLRSVSLGGLGAMTAVAIIAAATVSTNGLLWGRNFHLPPIFLPVPPPLYDDHTDRTSGNGLKVLLWGILTPVICCPDSRLSGTSIQLKFIA